MLQFIRAQQQAIQVSEVRKLSGTPTAVTYVGRDPVSGDRLLSAADGGIVKAKYLSYTEPVASPLLVNSGKLTQPTYMVSR